jgi:hypothetical protein
MRCITAKYVGQRKKYSTVDFNLTLADIGVAGLNITVSVAAVFGHSFFYR